MALLEPETTPLSRTHQRHSTSCIAPTHPSLHPLEIIPKLLTFHYNFHYTTPERSRANSGNYGRRWEVRMLPLPGVWGNLTSFVPYLKYFDDVHSFCSNYTDECDLIKLGVLTIRREKEKKFFLNFLGWKHGR